MSQSPPPMVIQLRDFLAEFYENWVDGKPPKGSSVALALALCDSLIERYPNLTAKQ